MVRRRKTPLPPEVVRKRLELRRSGAAGIHADQTARAYRVGRTNRVSTRQAQRRAAIDDQD